MKENLTERAKDFHIILDDVSIVSFVNNLLLFLSYYHISLILAFCLINLTVLFSFLLFFFSSQTDLSFSREYAAAVESKQVAQQEAQRAQFVVEKAKQERQEKMVRAEGEAKAAHMISLPPCVFSNYVRGQECCMSCFP